MPGRTEENAEGLFVEELATFQKQLSELLEAHEGKFCVIENSEIHDVCDTEEEAYNKGLDQFGLKPFLVKQILTEEPTLTCVYTRPVPPNDSGAH